MNSNRNGMTLVLSGPSGSGKSSIYRKALESLEGMEFSVSCTTRQPRAGELHGKDYYFISTDEFKAKVANDEFAEYAEVHGNFYGTLKSELSERMERGRDVLLDIDVQGAEQLRELCRAQEFFRRSCEFLFIAPPSFEVLEQRLHGRGTDSAEIIKRRVGNALGEISKWKDYNYIIVNDELDKAVIEFITLVHALRLKTSRMGKEPFNV